MYPSYETHAALERNHITVRTRCNKLHLGYLHAVDPETGSLALQTSTALLLLSPHTIADLNLNVEQGPAPVLPVHSPPLTRPSVSRDQLLHAFSERHIDAEIDHLNGGRVSVLRGLAFVQEPFGPDMCQSANESVLRRIRAIVTEISREDR